MLASSLRIPAIAILIAVAFPAAASARQYPETIPLPNGWQPEGTARVYDAASGPLLREYPLTSAPTFINDVR